jgi:hypothetical protein
MRDQRWKEAEWKRRVGRTRMEMESEMEMETGDPESAVGVDSALFQEDPTAIDLDAELMMAWATRKNGTLDFWHG